MSYCVAISWRAEDVDGERWLSQPVCFFDCLQGQARSPKTVLKLRP
jgi:hypothetical protein